MGHSGRWRGISAAVIFCVIALAGAPPAGALTPCAVTGSTLLRLSIPLGRPTWLWSGYPVNEFGGLAVSPFLSDHARLEWFNPSGTASVHESDLNPTLSDAQGKVQHPVLGINVRPPTGQVGVESGDWSGLTQSLSTAGEDFTGFRYVEIWVNDFRTDHSATRCSLHVDLGHVTEDAFWSPDSVPNGKLDTEDKNFDGRLDLSDNLSIMEDTGLDGLMDVHEPGYNPQTNPDPNKDDYHYSSNDPNDYSGINSYENSALGLPNARPDTEDLNRDGYPDFFSNYFEATLDLSSTARIDPITGIEVVTDVPNDFPLDPDVKPGNGWRLYRIPITADAFERHGSGASWQDIQHARVWVDGMTDSLTLQIGGIFIGDPSLKVSGVRAASLPAYPNPFRVNTAIEFNLLQPGMVRLRIFDVRGRLVHDLIDEALPAGGHRANWFGEDSNGRAVASGIYIYRLDAPGISEARRIIFLK